MLSSRFVPTRVPSAFSQFVIVDVENLVHFFVMLNIILLSFFLLAHFCHRLRPQRPRRFHSDQFRTPPFRFSGAGTSSLHNLIFYVLVDIYIDRKDCRWDVVSWLLSRFIRLLELL